MLITILKDSLLITSFVMITMLIIEYFSVQSRGKLFSKIRNSSSMQIIIAALLGLLPGCFGAFTAVSLFTHGIINFAGLVTAMIAATGDEAFVMIAMIPGSALKVFIIVFITALVAGFLVNIFIRKKTPVFSGSDHLKIHYDEPDMVFRRNMNWNELKKISFQRVLLLIIGLLFIFSFFIGLFELDSLFEKIFFITFAVIGLVIIVIVPDHFLQEHIWDHIFKKHLLRIFLWTLGALLFINLVIDYLHIEEWIRQNQLIILLVAVVIGIIPESGPHIIFITLFSQGTIPLSILVANSIVQDGHGALPLLAESKKSFLLLKMTNMLIGLLIGISGLLFGW